MVNGILYRPYRTSLFRSFDAFFEGSRIEDSILEGDYSRPLFGEECRHSTKLADEDVQRFCSLMLTHDQKSIG
jgi:hypothetical protein